MPEKLCTAHGKPIAISHQQLHCCHVILGRCLAHTGLQHTAVSMVYQYNTGSSYTLTLSRPYPTRREPTTPYAESTS
jgi:hypothetical protein